jgi:acyl dehydratase
VQTLYYEDIEAGRSLESPFHTVTREEIVAFARAWDPQPFHVEEAAAARSIFGGFAACAAHIFALQSRLAHELPARVALVAGLGGDGLELIAPVREGARVKLVRRFTGKRASRSRPEAGVVSIEHTLETPAGEVLFRTRGAMLVERRAP